MLLAWAAAAQECQRQRRLERRAEQARSRWLLAGWARRAGELRQNRLRLRGAEAHRLVVLLRNGWRGLAAAVAWSRAAELTLRQRLARAATVVAFQVRVRIWGSGDAAVREPGFRLLNEGTRQGG